MHNPSVIRDKHGTIHVVTTWARIHVSEYTSSDLTVECNCHIAFVISIFSREPKEPVWPFMTLQHKIMYYMTRVQRWLQNLQQYASGQSTASGVRFPRESKYINQSTLVKQLKHRKTPSSMQIMQRTYPSRITKHIAQCIIMFVSLTQKTYSKRTPNCVAYTALWW